MYHYCSKKTIDYTTKTKLPQLFHKALNLNDEFSVYWGSFKDPIAEDFNHHTALLAFNSKGEIVSAISFGQEGYIAMLKVIQEVCAAKLSNDYDELYQAKENFLEALDTYSIQKI